MTKAAAKEMVKPPAGLLQRMQEKAAKEAQDSEGSSRFLFARIGIDKRKINGSKIPKPVVRIVFPQVKDSDGNSKEVFLESLSFVTLMHEAKREVAYTTMDADGSRRIVNECFSVGPKRESIGIGTFHREHGDAQSRGAMSCNNCLINSESSPYDTRRLVVPFNQDKALEQNIRCSSRYLLLVALDPGQWLDEDKELNRPTLAFLDASMSSARGVMVKNSDDAEDLSRTLLAYPMKGKDVPKFKGTLPDGTTEEKDYKGIFHTLKSRPWQLGLDYGVEGAERGTSTSSIWLEVRAEPVGETPAEVHSFYMGDELDMAELTWVDEAVNSGHVAEHWFEYMKQGLRDSAGTYLKENDIERLAQVMANGNWGLLQERAQAALPALIQAEDEDGNAVSVEEVREAPPTGVEEFPPEADLPFE